MAEKKTRCAIYTRKSSEEGLDQAFNSLHAQREACEAYVLSQAGEGWTALKTVYDDGGFSGGNLDRPGLKQLLADVRAGAVDVVVVYKVDRLTRSLSDFAEIVKAFDASGVSFVSVTQAFNTTSSMGRLTLNMLLSFAQFEREVTGERIRDKIAASKAKGMWMGGVAPLGYDLPNDKTSRALVVNEAEAELVRHVFSRYLELGSVHQLTAELNAQGRTTKAWTAASGKAMGGRPFEPGGVYHVLRNRTYLGEITHRGESHPGRHQAIVDAETFARADALLKSNARERRNRSKRSFSLKGLIFDVDGHPMSPTTAKGRNATYRYYVSAPLQKSVKLDTSEHVIRRIPAEAVERLVGERLERIFDRGRVMRPFEMVRRVDLQAGCVEITLDPAPLGVKSEDDLGRVTRSFARADELAMRGSDLVLTTSVRLKTKGGRSWLVTPNGRSAQESPRIDPALAKALRSARELAVAHGVRPIGGAAYDTREFRSVDCPYNRKLIRFAFLAPDIQRSILEGRQSPMLSLDRLMRTDLPDAWSEQRRLFGLAEV